jgi:pimeloyl-ACP methyl ester carboxylesterase
VAIQHELSVPSGSLVLRATVLTPNLTPDPASGAGVLFVHGLGSDRLTNLERASAVADRHGAVCLAVDLGGHGASTGRLSEMTPGQNLRDVIAAYDVLASRPDVAAARIGVCAASYGAYLSVLLTRDRPVAGLLLRAPALYPDGSLDVPLGSRTRGDGRSARGFFDQFAGLACPVLVVESENDEVIGPEVIRAYLDALPTAEHRVLRGAGHALTDPAWRAAFQQMVLDFFADLGSR